MSPNITLLHWRLLLQYPCRLLLQYPCRLLRVGQRRIRLLL